MKQISYFFTLVIFLVAVLLFACDRKPTKRELEDKLDQMEADLDKMKESKQTIENFHKRETCKDENISIEECNEKKRKQATQDAADWESYSKTKMAEMDEIRRQIEDLKKAENAPK